MFGDHQPALTYIKMADESLLNNSYLKEYNAENTYRYIVPYKMWANYDIGTEKRPMTGASFLSLLVKDKANLSFNKWDQYRLKLKNALQAITLQGYFNRDGELYVYGDNEQTDNLIDEYQLAEYYILRDYDPLE